jgi:hypothetical protein
MPTLAPFRSSRPLWVTPSSLLFAWALCAVQGVTAAGFDGFAGIVSGAATAAVILTAVVLAVRSVAGLPLPRAGHRTLGRTLRARILRAGVIRQTDPDAPGRPRPRAPGQPAFAR